MNITRIAFFAAAHAAVAACTASPQGWADSAADAAGNSDSTMNADGPAADHVGVDTPQSTCGSSPTVLSGQTFAPNGTDAIPGVLVYVLADDATLPPAATTVQCQTCQNPPAALVSVTSSPDGTFSLSGGTLDAGGTFTIVFATGGFRHVLRHVAVGPCSHLVLTAAQTKLPGRTNGEDTIPRIAVAGYRTAGTGDANDRFTDVLDAIGIIGYETVDPDKSGSSGSGQTDLHTDLAALLSNMTQLRQYQIVIAPCGSLGNFNVATNLTPQMLTNLQTWLGLGGRLYASDLAYSIIDRADPNAIVFATGSTRGDPADVGVGFSSTSTMTIPGDVVDAQLRTWLSGLNISSPIQIHEFRDPWGAMDSIPDAELSGRMGPSGVILVSGTVSWHTGTTSMVTGNHPLTAMVDYAAPGAGSCGRVVFTSYHVQSMRTSVALTPQERVLEYLFFRLSTCIDVPG